MSIPLRTSLSLFSFHQYEIKITSSHRKLFRYPSPFYLEVKKMGESKLNLINNTNEDLLIKLLEISDMDSLTFSVESPIYLRYFENSLKSNNWEKVLDEGESEWYGNFRVVYKKGTYEITLVCDVDGYVFQFAITKR